ncbi:MAG TPA: adenylate/guanylate cyclase domain-containing protein [Acidimicrobiales bacterium]|nr:adenylate/guanylate cyclase domain-containing protein [Acidimicrobiales bacterium]
MADGPTWAGLEADLLGLPRYTAEQVAAQAGMNREHSRRLWRAMGFPDAPEDEPFFTELDLEILRSVNGLVTEGAVEVPELLQLTRATGQAQARAAEAEAKAILERTHAALGPGVEAEAVADTAMAAARAVAPDLERYVTYAWRRHFVAAMAREAGAEGVGAGAPVVVGFADLVGFTAFSQEAGEAELGQLVDHFEDLAYDLIAGRGGRVIKVIGDEVLFVLDDPVEAARLGLELAEAYSSDPQVPDVRVGLAYGSVLPRAGDVLGAPVNLASRLVNIARPATVLVSSELAERLESEDDLELRTLRPRRLKGIGRVPVIALRRRHQGGSP